MPPVRRTSLLALAAPTLALLGLAAPVRRTAAQEGPLPAGVTRGPSVEGISEYRLANGLRVLLFPDAARPQLLVNVTYLVGSRHEGYGETGMAHLLEHLVFAGTPAHRDIPGEIESRGATYNATTSFDRTNYYMLLPAADSTLAWALDLEADRMVNASFGAAEVRAEGAVVRNEHEAVENDPLRATAKRVLAAAYDVHAYGRFPIGTPEDVAQASAERVRAFYSRHYRPDNAVLLVAGRMDAAQTLRLVADRFGRIPPARGAVATDPATSEPAQEGERTVTIRRAAAEHLVAVFHKIPPGAHPDAAALRVLDQVMADMPGGRLHAALVARGAATRVGAHALLQRDPGGLLWYAALPAASAPSRGEDALLRALDDLGRRPPTDEEVARAKAALLAQATRALTRPDTLGLALSEAMAMGDWRLFFLTRDRVRAVTATEVRRVASRYVRQSNRTIGRLVATTEPDRVSLAPMAAGAVDSMLRAYRGADTVASGERFDPSPENVEARVVRGRLPAGLETAVLPRRTRGSAATLLLTLRYGDERSLHGRTVAGGLAATMLLRGGGGLTRRQLRDSLDRLGARASVTALSPNSLRVTIEGTRATLPAAFAIVARMMRAPSFDATELEEARRERVALLEAQRAEPMQAGPNALMRASMDVPRGHPRHVLSLEEEAAATRATTLDEVRRFHRDLHGAHAGELVVVGDVEPSAVVSLATSLLGDWRGVRPFTPVPAGHAAVPPSRVTVPTPDRPNAFIAAGLPLRLGDGDVDYPALAVANHILGEGMLGSRLVQRIRVKEGLSYGGGSALMVGPDERQGRFLVAAIAAPLNIGRVEAAIRDELRRAIADGFTDAEVSRARTAILQQRQVARTHDATLASQLSNALYHDRTLAFDAAVERAIAAVTPEQVSAAFRKHVDPSRLTVVHAGDFSKTAAP